MQKTKRERERERNNNYRWNIWENITKLAN